MNSEAKIVKTNDGTDTIYLPNLNEHYHSIHGSRNESEHVYIKMGLKYFIDQNPSVKNIHILEVGFGTGLNALLTYQFSKENNIQVHYTTLEPYPVKEDIYSKLNFNFSEEEKEVFLELHNAQWDQEVFLEEHFLLKKVKTKIEKFSDNHTYHIIYFDAFAPNKQKKIWDSGNFLKLKNVLDSDTGILVTYCAQGEFKRTVKKVGFFVEELVGPPGKRIMTRLNKLSKKD